jgi:hypothetical protein
VVLRGGLGNQLHQIAAGVSLAERLNGSVRIFSKIVDTANNPTRRGYYKSLNLRGLFPDTIITQVNSVEWFLFSLLNRMNWPCGSYYLIDESKFEWRRLRIGAHILKGYFQESRFLPKNISPSNLFSNVNPLNESITVHIRLTDFLTIDASPLDEKYFASGIKYFSVKTPNLAIRIFSDDITAARKMIASHNRVTFPEATHALSPPELLQELASSKYLVASRSSLCYWAAKVVSSRGGKVLSPWSEDLHDGNWIKI